MPTLLINGQRVDAADGATILDAARAAEIDLPTLCWYPKLPTVGNCRICVVSVEGEDKLLPACAATVAEGMRVETESAAALDARRGVLQMLLERYPADHLINGGRAEPRNEFEEYVARYGVTPRAVAAHELSLRQGDERPGDPMISHDMSLCILDALRAGMRGHSGGRGARRGLPGRGRPDRGGSRRRSGQGRLHLVRRVRSGLPYRRHLRGHAA